MPKIHTRILPVDRMIAPARMCRALRELRPDLVIMLGEAGGAPKIRLETTAWNELDFPIPDNGGHQPRKQMIDPHAVGNIASTLPCDVSKDPGRYLCNLLLFRTLGYLQKHQPDARAGFIHIPLESVCPTRQAVVALSLVIARMRADRRN
jgi:pyroglutamyl-peptidase